MPWIRYIVYFFGIAVITAMIVVLEVAFPGSLKLHIVHRPEDVFGTSEHSPIEYIQLVILAACGLLMAWVARYCPSQRPIAFVFGGLALIFFIRELHYFFDRVFADNFWQVLIAIPASLLIAYVVRQWRRFKIAWARIWPSPGMALLFAGAVILFAFVHLVGHGGLWQSIMDDNYVRAVKLAVEEFIELSGYFLWLIGTIEYAYQARAIAYREPQPAAQRLREKRRHDQEGPY